MLLARQGQAQCCHLRGAQVLVAGRAAQAVARELPGLQAEHRQGVEPGAFAKHLARLRPGGIEQDKQRAFSGRHLHLGDDALRGDKLAGKHQIGLPLRVGQQAQQGRIDRRARPAIGGGVTHHVGDQPAGIAGFERLDVAHDQAHARARRHLGAQGTQAKAEANPAIGAARHARTTGDKGFVATRQTRLAQAGDRMAHGAARR